LFRIITPTKAVDENTKLITYQCEHVLSTLLDTVIFRGFQTDNLTTYDNISSLLAFQSDLNWVVGRVDFSYNFSYNWSNTNVLSALFSITKPFLDAYMWTWDTTVYPWTLNLIALDDAPSAYIRYGKNLRGITKEIDTSQLCTRLYALGYGDGDNQLGIEKVNGGKPYIDADTIGTYGVISRIFSDKSYEDATELLNASKALLNGLKTPRVTYTVSAADLYRITGDSIDKFEIGAMVDVNDTEAGEHFQTRIVGLSKSDVEGNPGDVTITLANKSDNIADEIASLTERQLINDLYAQGATNIYTNDYSDNCDPNNPATIRFYVPEDAVRVNSVMLNYEVTEFRAYSKATKSGGGSTQTSSSGGGTTQTTTSGGGTTKTTTSGGGTTQTTSSGGDTTQTSSSGGDHRHLVFKYNPNVSGAVNTYRFTDANGRLVDLSASPDDLYTAGSSGNHTHSVTIPSHTHRVTIPDHNHNVTIPDHSHSVTIPNHTHTVTIPAHTHGIDYGIYIGPKPTSVTVKVDGTTVSGLGLSEDGVDITPYLAKDSDGRVTRGTWHEITITPNDLGRVTANVVTRLFIQSRGGGNY